MTLLERIEARPTLPAAIEMGIDMMLSIEALHQHGILHRDIKPENFVVDTTGKTTPIDFGFSRIVRETPSATLTMSDEEGERMVRQVTWPLSYLNED